MGGGSTGNAEDAALVVPTSYFRTFIEALIEKHEKDRPNMAYPTEGYARNELGHLQGGELRKKFTTGRQWIQWETGISDRSLRRLLSETQYIPEKRVDEILTRLNYSHILGTEQMPVIKNPKWSDERFRQWQQRKTRKKLATKPQIDQLGA